MSKTPTINPTASMILSADFKTGKPVVSGHVLRYVDGDNGRQKAVSDNQSFVVLKEIGAGGNNTVYSALDSVRGELVALRIPKYSDFEVFEHLTDEVTLTRRVRNVDSDVVVDVLGVVLNVNLEVEAVMLELIEGKTLREVMYPTRRADEGEVIYVDGEEQLAVGGELVFDFEAEAFRPEVLIQWALDLISYLEAASKAGVVHRDLKPANLFVVDGRLKVADFGSATRVGYRPSDIRGTFAYLAPEICKGNDPFLNVTSDIYAAGVILYELFSKKRPFIPDPNLARDKRELAYVAFHLNGEYADITREINRLMPLDIAQKIQYVIFKMLSKNPADRIRLREMREILEEALSDVTDWHLAKSSGRS